MTPVAAPSPPPPNADTPTAQQRESTTTIFQRSVEGRRAGSVPPCDVPERPLDELIPPNLRRERPAELPEVSEPEIMCPLRHLVVGAVGIRAWGARCHPRSASRARARVRERW